jgi:hypothetical protein
MKLSKERLKEIVNEELNYLKQEEAAEKVASEKGESIIVQKLKQKVGSSAVSQIQRRLQSVITPAFLKKISAQSGLGKGQVLVGLLELLGVPPQEILQSISSIRAVSAQAAKDEM